MVLGGHLRKPLWLGATGLVTAHTENSHIEFLRRDRGIIRVTGERPVAALAAHSRMLPFRFYVQHIRMAGLACLVSRKRNGAGCNFPQRVSAEMSIAAKTMRNQQAPCNHKQDEANNENKGKPEQVLCVFEFFHGYFTFPPHLPVRTSSEAPRLRCWH